jgi:hypothetical protein
MRQNVEQIGAGREMRVLPIKRDRPACPPVHLARGRSGIIAVQEQLLLEQVEIEAAHLPGTKRRRRKKADQRQGEEHALRHRYTLARLGPRPNPP